MAGDKKISDLALVTLATTDAFIVQRGTDNKKVTGLTTKAYTDSQDASVQSYSIQRANHTGTQLASTISDFTETAQDAVGSILTDTSTIDFIYNDAGNVITADVKDASITNAKVASGIDAVKIGDGTVSNIEFQTLSDIDIDVTIQAQLNGKENADATILKQANVVDNLTSTSTIAPLSAKQGKTLQDTKANDNAVVHNTGDETVAGIKTFSSAPNFSSLTASQILELDASKNITSAAKSTAYNKNFETTATEIKMNGTQSLGVSNNVPRADHTHPSDTTKQNLISSPTNNNIVTTNGSGQSQDSGKAFSTDGTFASNSDNLIPTEKAIKTYIASAVAGLWDYRGAYDASSNTFPTSGGSGTGGAILKGDIWVISVAGTLGGSAVNISDLIIANTDTPGQTSSNWNIIEGNIGYTPENIANKENSTIDTSTTKYPTVNLLKTGLDTKIAKSSITNTWQGVDQTLVTSQKALHDALNSMSDYEGVYVDPTNGNDTTGAGTLAKPYQTIQKVLDTIASTRVIYVKGSTTADIIFGASNQSMIIVLDPKSQHSGNITLVSGNTSIYFISESGTALLAGTINDGCSGSIYYNCQISGTYNKTGGSGGATPSGYVEFGPNSCVDGLVLNISGNSTIRTLGTGAMGILTQSNGIFAGQHSGSIICPALSGGANPLLGQPICLLQGNIQLITNATKSLTCTATYGIIYLAGISTLQNDFTTYGKIDFTGAGATCYCYVWAHTQLAPSGDVFPITGAIQANSANYLNASRTPTNYSVSGTNIKQHLDGIDTSIGTKANNSAVVHNTGDETVAGVKTFSSSPILSSLTASELLATDANKKPQSLPVATYPSLVELSYVKGVTSAIQTQMSGKQNLNSDLTAIAGLTPSNDDILQRKAGAWVNRSIAQLSTDLNLSGTNTGDETTTTLGSKINGASAKTTPVDADMLGLMDSAASNILKKLSWANVKATLKTYFDTLYEGVITNLPYTKGGTGINSLTSQEDKYLKVKSDASGFELVSLAGSTVRKTYFVSESGSDTNNGAGIETALATVAQAISLTDNSGTKIIVLPGTYPENTTISKQNISISTLGEEKGDVANFTGTLTFSHTTSINQLSGLKIGTLVKSGNGDLYLNKVAIGTGGFSDSGNGTLEVVASNIGGLLSITGTGNKTLKNGCNASNITINNSSCNFAINDCDKILPLSAGTALAITNGKVRLRNTKFYTFDGSYPSAIIASAGEIVIDSCSILNQDNTLGQITISSGVSYAERNVVRSLSSTISGTKNSDKTIFDNINLPLETANRIAIIDSNKNITSADTGTYPSLTEFAYLKGATRGVATPFTGDSGSGGTYGAVPAPSSGQGTSKGGACPVSLRANGSWQSDPYVSMRVYRDSSEQSLLSGQYEYIIFNASEKDTNSIYNLAGASSDPRATIPYNGRYRIGWSATTYGVAQVAFGIMINGNIADINKSWQYYASTSEYKTTTGFIERDFSANDVIQIRIYPFASGGKIVPQGTWFSIESLYFT